MKNNIMVIFLLMTSISHAEPVWTLSNRVDKSDVVVVGRFEKSNDTGETNSVGLRNIPVAGVQSVFHVEAVLKGAVSNNLFSVKHYRRLPTSFFDVVMTPGPKYSFVNFMKSTNSLTAYHNELYLIFLKQTNGMLVPVTGTIHPIGSFLKLEQYWGDKAEQTLRE